MQVIKTNVIIESASVSKPKRDIPNNAIKMPKQNEPAAMRPLRISSHVYHHVLRSKPKQTLIIYHGREAAP